MLRERLLAIVDQAVPNPEHLSRFERDAVVDHLMSDEVQVKSLEDLEIVTENMLPQWLALVPKTKLVKAFNGASTHQVEKQSTATKATLDRSRPLQPGNKTNYIRSSSSSSSSSQTNLTSIGYQYNVKWTSLPQTLLEKMKEANDAQKSAADSVLRDFRYALALNLLDDYQGFKENNPSAQKTPGRKIYIDIGNEVQRKYPYAIRESLGEVVYSDGKVNFTRKLEICCENKCREVGAEKEKLSVKKGKGVPGIIEKEYSPEITTIMLRRQKNIKQKLKAEFENGMMDTLDEEYLERKMKEAYELQRQDILKCREAVTDIDSGEDEPEPEEKAVQVLLNEWPLLFQVEHINNHNKRLSGLDLKKKLTDFCNKKPLQYLSLFLTCSSKKNMENLAMKHNLESRIQHIGTPSLFLLNFTMLSNHFEEPYNSVLQSVEKTTHPDELAYLPTTVCHPCIISLGDVYTSEGFYVVVDKVALAKTSNFLEAFLVLFNTCFALDLQYPPMPLTFEFIERVVLEMAVEKTRCKNTKGKVLLTMTKAVKDLGQEFVKFTEYMDEHLD